MCISGGCQYPMTLIQVHKVLLENVRLGKLWVRWGLKWLLDLWEASALSQMWLLLQRLSNTPATSAEMAPHCCVFWETPGWGGCAPHSPSFTFPRHKEPRCLWCAVKGANARHPKCLRKQSRPSPLVFRLCHCALIQGGSCCTAWMLTSGAREQ